MRMADDTEFDAELLLADEATWLVFLETAFRKNTIGSDTLAHLLFTLKEAIESGPDGLGRVINTLSDGIRLTYLYTEEHKLALRLYMLYLTGHLNPQDEPLTLLNRAIERGVADIKRARKKKGATKSNRIGKRGTSKRKIITISSNQ